MILGTWYLVPGTRVGYFLDVNDDDDDDDIDTNTEQQLWNWNLINFSYQKFDIVQDYALRVLGAIPDLPSCPDRYSGKLPASAMEHRDKKNTVMQ